MQQKQPKILNVTINDPPPILKTTGILNKMAKTPQKFENSQNTPEIDSKCPKS